MSLVRLGDRVIASGLVDAVETVRVQPLVEGQLIEELLVDVGDTVTKAQVLARLSTSAPDFRLRELAASHALAKAQIAQAEAGHHQAVTKAREAERQAARNAELAAAGSIPRAQADQTAAAADASRSAVRGAEQAVVAFQAQLALVKAQIANAKLQLSYTEVRAPVGGLIVARDAHQGAVAAAAEAMFTIARDGAMELRAELSQQDLLRLKVGQRAFLLDAEQARPVAGRIRLVEPMIDPATRLGIARIEVSDPSQILMGMFLNTEILVAEEETLAVPATAVRFGSDGATVMRVVDGVAQRTSVVVGIREDGLIGIVNGLEEADLVVTKAAAFLRDGDRINPVPAEPDILSVALARRE